jgi:DNA topoisomerase-1
LRRRVSRDLAKRGLPRDKVIAAVVRLLEATLVRVGNEEYARDNRSYGLTTMRNRHAAVRGSALKFSFRGKSGVKHTVGLRDKRLARVVRDCQDLPGQRLFEYLDDDGEIRAVDSDDVNAYLQDAMGADFSAKDFRTWAGTVLAVRALRELEREQESASGSGSGEARKVGDGKPTKKQVTRAVERVAAELGNTPTVCRKCYIHPVVLDSYMDGTLTRSLARRADVQLTSDSARLRADERLVLSVLGRRRHSAVTHPEQV